MPTKEELDKQLAKLDEERETSFNNRMKKKGEEEKKNGYKFYGCLH
jgi:hypothetical protein